MTTITVKTEGSKKTVVFDKKSYEFNIESDEDLSFMGDKNTMDPIIEMLAKVYEIGKENQTVIFVQK